MQYVLVIYGEGGGCDYTIGCNCRVDIINADQREFAEEAALNTIAKVNHGDVKVADAVLYEISHSAEIPVKHQLIWR